MKQILTIILIPLFLLEICFHLITNFKYDKRINDFTSCIYYKIIHYNFNKKIN